jgi:hypothetical protein
MCEGNRNPKKENTIQVGGANAGMMLSKNTAKKRIKRGLILFSSLSRVYPKLATSDGSGHIRV